MIRYSTFSIHRLHRLFFYLLLIFLPTQLGYHAWPEWAMVLGRRVDYLSPTLYATDILLLLTIGFWGLSVFLNKRGGNPKSQIPNPKQIQISKSKIQNRYIFIGLLSFIFLNVYFSITRPVTLYHWIKVAEFGLLGWYIVKTRPRLSLITYFLSLSVLYSSLIAIGQFMLQHSVGGPLWFLGERTFTIDTPGIARVDLNFSLFTFQFSLFALRAYGTFPHPNVLGGFLAATLPLVIIQLSNYPIVKLSNIKKYMYIITMMLGIIALAFTFSRSAWVVGGVAIVLTIARIQNTELRILRYFYFRIFSLVIMLVIILYSLFSVLNSYDESVVVRLALNNSVVAMWKQNPWLGVGLGNFLVALPDYLPSREIYFLQPVHNIYLLLLSEVGVVGVGLICFIIYWVLNTEYRMPNTEKKYIPFNFIIQYSLFSILFLGLVDHYVLTLQQGRLLLIVLLALSYRGRR